MQFQESMTHANALFRAGHLRTALAKYHVIREMAPHAAAPHSRCINILMRLREFSAAQEEISLFLDSWPQNASMRIKAAHALILMGGRPDEAAAELDAAQSLLREPGKGHRQSTVDAMRQQIGKLQPDGTESAASRAASGEDPGRVQVHCMEPHRVHCFDCLQRISIAQVVERVFLENRLVL